MADRYDYDDDRRDYDRPRRGRRVYRREAPFDERYDDYGDYEWEGRRAPREYSREYEYEEPNRVWVYERRRPSRRAPQDYAAWEERFDEGNPQFEYERTSRRSPEAYSWSGHRQDRDPELNDEYLRYRTQRRAPQQYASSEWRSPRPGYGYNEQVYERRPEWRERDWVQRGEFAGVGPRGYKRSDDRIFEEVCERLTHHGGVDASDIEVEVEDGEVTMKGEVPNRRMKVMAEDAVETVPGVWDVHNHLHLNPRVDRVGHSGVYPMSDVDEAPEDAEVEDMESWGEPDKKKK